MARGATLGPVENQFAIRLRFKPKLSNGAHARLLKQRALAPGLSAVAGQQQERIPGQRLDELPADPAVREISELNLLVGGGAHALERLVPGAAAVFAGEQDGVESG